MGRKMEMRLLLVSASLVVMASAAIYVCRTYPLKVGVPSGLVAILCVLGAAAALDMIRHHPADSHSIKTLISHYTIILMLNTLARLLWLRRLRQSKNCGKTQEDTLLSMLRKNKDTEYGKRYNFGGIKSREQYIIAHPLTDYSHYADYIERLASGEKNILTKDPPAYFALTSGTTGGNKMYPLTKELNSMMRWSFLSTASTMYKTLGSLQRSWIFDLPPAARSTATGIPKGPASVYWIPPSRYNIYPLVGRKLTQEVPSYYTQAVFALAEKELGVIAAFSSNLLYAFFKFVEKNWDSLCADIQEGRIGTTVDMDEDIRHELNKCIKANPTRAAELRKELPKGVRGIAKRIWPNLRVVTMAKSGSFSHCAKALLGNHLEGLHAVCTGHGSTECLSGTNLQMEQPDRDVFTMIPDICMLEFIPLEDIDSENPRTLFMDQLEIGGKYELVTTSPHGLYRLRIGDVLNVVDYFNTIPAYEFCYRVGQRLSVAYERTPEDRIYKAVEKAAEVWPAGVRLRDYTSVESFVIESITGERSETEHYVFFLEFEGCDQSAPLTPEDVQKLDEAICEVHEPYKVYRAKGCIAPCRVIQVTPETFQGLMRRLWAGFQNQQFKMPRVLRREEFLKYLLEQRVA